MNKHFNIALCCLALLAAATGCKEEKKSDIIIVKSQNTKEKKTVKTVRSLNQTREVDWVGSHYTVEIKQARDSARTIVAVGDDRYYENNVRLRIVRADGTAFFNRTFSKSYFKDYVEPSFYNEGTLVSIIYSSAEADRLSFFVAVGNPDQSSDESATLRLYVDKFGNVKVEKVVQQEGDEEFVGD